MEIGEKKKIPVDVKFHPETGHVGKIVWISEDKQNVAVECERLHNRKKAVFMLKLDSTK